MMPVVPFEIFKLLFLKENNIIKLRIKVESKLRNTRSEKEL